MFHNSYGVNLDAVLFTSTVHMRIF